MTLRLELTTLIGTPFTRTTRLVNLGNYHSREVLADVLIASIDDMRRSLETGQAQGAGQIDTREWMLAQNLAEYQELAQAQRIWQEAITYQIMQAQDQWVPVRDLVREHLQAAHRDLRQEAATHPTPEPVNANDEKREAGQTVAGWPWTNPEPEHRSLGAPDGVPGGALGPGQVPHAQV